MPLVAPKTYSAGLFLGLVGVVIGIDSTIPLLPLGDIATSLSVLPLGLGGVATL